MRDDTLLIDDVVIGDAVLRDSVRRDSATDASVTGVSRCIWERAVVSSMPPAPFLTKSWTVCRPCSAR
jgi:hypothetical protein